MSPVTRVEFEALKRRVDALDGGANVPDVNAPADPLPRSPSIQLSAVTAKVSGRTYSVSAVATASADTQLKYLQIAVRGQRAGDVGFNPDVTLKAGVPFKVSGTSGGSGELVAYLAYSVDGSTWVDGPKTKFTVATAPGSATPVPAAPGSSAPVGDASAGRSVALVGRSKLGFNSLVFRQTPEDAEEFGTRRGVPVDGFLWFTSRANWSDLRWGFDRGYREWLGSGRLIVTSMPHAPESEGDQMNQRGAQNAYANEQRDLGRFLTDAGMNVPNFVLRLDWECNGDWYAWSANRPGGPSALRESLRNAVTNLRAGGLTKAKFDLCFNKGPSQSGADVDIFPGRDVIDVIGIDQYDMWQPSYDDSDWRREMAKAPSMLSVADFAADNGIMWSMDEGGNTHGDDTKGGDNPFYWDKVYATIQENLASCAWHVTYDDAGAPADLAHDFASNPRGFERYKQLWRRG